MVGLTAIDFGMKNHGKVNMYWMKHSKRVSCNMLIIKTNLSKITLEIKHPMKEDQIVLNNVISKYEFLFMEP